MARSCLFLFAALLCAAVSAEDSDVSYSVNINKKNTADAASSLAGALRTTGAYPVSPVVSVHTFYLVDFTETATAADAEPAASGTATTLISVTGPNEVVIAYELGGILSYDEESIRLSALHGTGLDATQVTVIVTSSFIIRGVVQFADSMTVFEIRTAIASNLDVPIENVTVSDEASVAARRSLLADPTYKFYNVAVTTDNFAKATNAVNEVASKAKPGSAAALIVAKVKTTFTSKTGQTIKAIFKEKLASTTVAELTQKVNDKLTEDGLWAAPPA